MTVLTKSVEVILLSIPNSDDLRGYCRINHPCTRRTLADSASIWPVEIQLMCYIPIWEWMFDGWYTVPIGCAKYVIHWVSLFLQICGSQNGFIVGWRLINDAFVPCQASYYWFQKELTFGSSITVLTEKVSKDGAGNQVSARNVPG